MIILGIESSCDETACAIVENGREVLANAISSQIFLHKKTQGVVPEVAARAHVEQTQLVLEEALRESGVSWEEIDAIAVTVGPGLMTSVMVGVNFAAGLAFVKKKPIIPVNHIEGHLYSCWLDLPEGEEVLFPAVVLSVSGGHNDLYLVKSMQEYELLGKTQDDAAGEAYDKAAKLLGLEYPGGPVISRIAKDGDGNAYKLPKPMLKEGFNFSFSGLKSAFARLIEEVKAGKGIVGFEGALPDLAASFQKTINETLAYKACKAVEMFRAREIHLVGGVSANLHLRETIKSKLPGGVKLRHPLDFNYCTDNAAMIAGRAFYLDRSVWLDAGKTPDLLTWDKVKKA